MNTLIGIISAIVLVMEVFELWEKSSYNVIILAMLAGIAYAIYIWFKCVSKNSSQTSKINLEKEEEPKVTETRPNAKPTISKISASIESVVNNIAESVSSHNTPQIPYHQYYTEYDKTRASLIWRVYYYTPKTKHFTSFNLWAKTDIKDLSKNSSLQNESTTRKFQRILNAAGGYVEKNGFAQITVTDDIKDILPITEDERYIFMQYGTAAEAADKLINRLNNILKDKATIFKFS